MSWKEKLDNIQFEITTGDGKTYQPLWVSGEKSKDFNISKYDFINTEGSYIDRKKAQSNIYPLTFFFQGEDNIEQCNDFEASANDSRAWEIEHPFYGTIKGQPTNLKRNDSSFNVTTVTVDFWESIDGEFPNSEISIKDETKSKVNLVDSLSSNFFIENSNPEISDITLFKENIVLSGAKFTPDSESFNDYKNTVSAAVKSADNLVVDAETAFNDAQKVINKPSDFASSVISKVSSYESAYEVLKSSLGGLFSKYNFESQAATILSALCNSVVNPSGDDYITRTDIESVNSDLVSLYEDYISTLDSNQVSIYDIGNSWAPNIQIQSALADLIFFTSNSLFLLSFDARQERTFELTKDSNLILLTHRFMGLASDENLDVFREINNIKNNELFRIRKGRTIKYFI